MVESPLFEGRFFSSRCNDPKIADANTQYSSKKWLISTALSSFIDDWVATHRMADLCPDGDPWERPLQPLRKPGSVHGLLPRCGAVIQRPKNGIDLESAGASDANQLWPLSQQPMLWILYVSLQSANDSGPVYGVSYFSYSFCSRDRELNPTK